MAGPAQESSRVDPARGARPGSWVWAPPGFVARRRSVPTGQARAPQSGRARQPGDPRCCAVSGASENPPREHNAFSTKRWHCGNPTPQGTAPFPSQPSRSQALTLETGARPAAGDQSACRRSVSMFPATVNHHPPTHVQEKQTQCRKEPKPRQDVCWWALNGWVPTCGGCPRAGYPSERWVRRCVVRQAHHERDVLLTTSEVSLAPRRVPIPKDG